MVGSLSWRDLEGSTGSGRLTVVACLRGIYSGVVGSLSWRVLEGSTVVGSLSWRVLEGSTAEWSTHCRGMS